MAEPITLPWPPKELSPNSRAHWAAKHKKRKPYRQMAGYKAIEAGWRKLPFDAPDIPIRFDFHPPDRRARDLDNLVGQMKAAQDGLADGMGVNDCRFVPTYKLHDFDEKLKGIVRVTL